MKISVIIPVYNAESYIGRCIESVQVQTFGDWQMILVDDGSNDNSLAICQKYAEIDDRIQVMHQENAGAGAARNTGLTKALGEYIVFIDSDDYVAEYYFELLSNNNEDVGFMNVEDVDGNGCIVS